MRRNAALKAVFVFFMVPSWRGQQTGAMEKGNEAISHGVDPAGPAVRSHGKR